MNVYGNDTVVGSFSVRQAKSSLEPAQGLVVLPTVDMSLSEVVEHSELDLVIFNDLFINLDCFAEHPHALIVLVALVYVEALGRLVIVVVAASEAHHVAVSFGRWRRKDPTRSGK